MRNKRRGKALKTFQKVFAVTFLVLIAAMIAGEAAMPDRAYSPVEKRMLSQFPAFSRERLFSGDFMSGMEDYAKDQFPYRDLLMKIKTEGLRLVGQNESQGVFYMKNGALAEAFEMPDAAKTAETTQEINAFYQRTGQAEHYFLLVPTAVNIDREELPDHALTDDQDAYMDAFFNALPAKMEKVDVREAFRASSENLYYRTDHHWTTEGAYLAAKALYRAMEIDNEYAFSGGTVANDFVGSLAAKSGFTPKTADAITLYKLDHIPENDFYYTVSYEMEHEMKATVYDASALDGDDPYEVFFGGNHPLIRIETSLDSDRHLLIFKDSYANALIPFLVPYFKTVTVVDPRYYGEDVDLLVSESGFTDILYVYNANTLSTDAALATVLRNDQ